MNIFLSWSGETSRQLAAALKTWLPDVVNALRPWVSSEDIAVGSRWYEYLAAQLENTQVGILCITPDNARAPWMLFEAGALSKSVDSSLVCLYLHGLSFAQLTGPLTEYQATTATEAGTLKLLRSLNDTLGEDRLPDAQLERVFERSWPDLARAIGTIKTDPKDTRIARSDHDMLEELLELTCQAAKMNLPVPRQTPRQRPLAYSAADIFLDRQVEIFAAKATGTIIHPDNAAEWMSASAVPDTARPLDGSWASRWFEEDEFSGRRSWQTGAAFIKSTQSSVIIVHMDAAFSYLMIARWADETTLIGRHYNLDRAGDTSPWKAHVHDAHRIDGEWERGHWDLRR